MTDVTQILSQIEQGDQAAAEQLLPLVYEHLKKLAAVKMAAERPDHTLQATALVNEVFMWLMDRHEVRWESRTHFFGFAAQLMRRILVDYARAHKAEKRGSGAAAAPLDEALNLAMTRDVDLVALDDALKDLARLDPDGSRVVEMRFFAGLTHQEIAEVMGVSTMTVRRQWTAARLWLFRRLKRD